MWLQAIAAERTSHSKTQQRGQALHGIEGMRASTGPSIITARPPPHKIVATPADTANHESLRSASFTDLLLARESQSRRYWQTQRLGISSQVIKRGVRTSAIFTDRECCRIPCHCRLGLALDRPRPDGPAAGDGWSGNIDVSDCNGDGGVCPFVVATLLPLTSITMLFAVRMNGSI